MATSTIPTVTIQPRSQTGSRESRRLREQGQLPVVIYGHGQDPVHGSVDYRTFTDLLHDGARLIEADTGGKGDSCLVKDVQWDFLGTTILHVDLNRVDLTESVTVTVELALKGEAPGLKEPGTYLEHPLTELDVTCRADSIPDQIDVDVSKLDVGGMIYASDLTMPPGVELASDGELLIAHVATVTVTEEEEEEAEAAAEGEPEVIGRKEGEEEGGEEE